MGRPEAIAEQEERITGLDRWSGTDWPNAADGEAATDPATGSDPKNLRPSIPAFKIRQVVLARDSCKAHLPRRLATKGGGLCAGVEWKPDDSIFFQLINNCRCVGLTEMWLQRVNEPCYLTVIAFIRRLHHVPSVGDACSEFKVFGRKTADSFYQPSRSHIDTWLRPH